MSFAAATPTVTIDTMGPVIVTATEMRRTPEVSEAQWRELRSATGIVIRALLLGL